MPRRLAALAVFALLTGCQSLYFQPACRAQQCRLTDRDRQVCEVGPNAAAEKNFLS